MLNSLRRFVQTSRWGKTFLGLSLFVLAATGFVPLAGCEKDRDHKVRYRPEEREQYDRHDDERGGDRDRDERRGRGDDDKGKHEHEGERGDH